MYTKEKRAKERAEEDEEDGRRRRTVTRTTEDEGEEPGRERIKIKTKIEPWKTVKVHTGAVLCYTYA